MIAHFFREYPRPNGVTTAVEALARGMTELGIEHVVLTGEDANAPNLRSLPRLSSRRRNPFVTPRDRWDHALDGVSVLFTHGMFTPSCAALTRWARSRGIPVVAVPHDPYDPTRWARRRARKELYWRAVERRWLEEAAAIFLLSPRHEAPLRARRVTTPAPTVPAGLAHWPAPRPQPLRRRRPGSLAVAYVGRYDVLQKGLDLLVDAAALLRAGGRTVQLHLVGAATAAERLAVDRHAQRAGVADLITHHGWVRSLDEAFEHVDALVVPSRGEGFSLTTVEALGAGLPVVVSRGAGVVDWLDGHRAAVLAEPEPSALAAALRTVDDHYGEVALAAAEGRSWVRDRFGPRRVATDWLAALEGCELRAGGSTPR